FFFRQVLFLLIKRAKPKRSKPKYTKYQTKGPQTQRATTLMAEAQRLKSLQRNHSYSTPLCLHAGEFHRSNEISSDYTGEPRTTDILLLYVLAVVGEFHHHPRSHPRWPTTPYLTTRTTPHLSHLDLITTTQRTSGSKTAARSFASLHSPGDGGSEKASTSRIKTGDDGSRVASISRKKHHLNMQAAPSPPGASN
ncbi:hypothetical protein HID58_053190, partial [Brassica napus]